MESLFFLWLISSEFSGLIVLLVCWSDRQSCRTLREQSCEYKFFLLAPIILCNAVVCAVPAWLQEDVLRLLPTIPRNLLCEK